MTAFELAQRFVGEIKEIPGPQNEPFIQWAHSLCGLGTDQPDEIAWCSSFANSVAWLLRLPRSKSAMARSWLSVGVPIDLKDAVPGYDVVILSRGTPPSGHVGFFAGLEGDRIHVLGGNQGDAVTVASFPATMLLGVRRLKG